MISRALPFVLPALLATAGCGARSSLLDGSRPAPDGGARAACHPLTESSPAVTLPEAAGFDEQRPALVSLGAGPAIAVVFGLHPSIPTGSEPIADVALDPWGAWPPAVAAPHPVFDAGGSSFLVAARPDAAYSFLAEATNGEVWFASSVDPAGTAAAASFGETGAPRVLARSGKLVLGAVESVAVPPPPDGLLSNLAITVLVDGEGGLYGTWACGIGPLVGDAIPVGDGFLLATANQGVNPLCVVENGVFKVGPADHLWLRHLTMNGNDTPGVESLIFPDPIERVRLVPRSSGAWVVAQTRGAGGLTGPIQVQAIDAAGHPDPTFGTISAAPAGSHGFSTAPLGDGFALAWIEPAGTIRVAIFDEKGAELASTTVASAASVTDPVALIAAKDGSAFVVGWSEQAPGAAARVHLTRFGCLSD